MNANALAIIDDLPNDELAERLRDAYALGFAVAVGIDDNGTWYAVIGPVGQPVGFTVTSDVEDDPLALLDIALHAAQESEASR